MVTEGELTFLYDKEKALLFDSKIEIANKYFADLQNHYENAISDPIDKEFLLSEIEIFVSGEDGSNVGWQEIFHLCHETGDIFVAPSVFDQILRFRSGKILQLLEKYPVLTRNIDILELTNLMNLHTKAQPGYGCNKRPLDAEQRTRLESFFQLVSARIAVFENRQGSKKPGRKPKYDSEDRKMVFERLEQKRKATGKERLSANEKYKAVLDDESYNCVLKYTSADPSEKEVVKVIDSLISNFKG